MAAKTWESDFRYEAICESVKVFNATNSDDLFSYPGSLCVPVAKKPIVGWTPGRIFLIFLVLGFVFLGGGVFMMGTAERNAKRGVGGNSTVLNSIGTGLGIAGMACFFLPLMLDRFVMKLLIGSRARELTRRPGELVCTEVSNSDRGKMKISIDGDDYVLLLADYENQRLLIEGIAARYLIHGRDVVEVLPFTFMNYVGAEIRYRITDKVALSIAIARVSILLEVIRQVPVLFFLRRLIKNRVLSVCTQALRPNNPLPPVS